MPLLLNATWIVIKKKLIASFTILFLVVTQLVIFSMACAQSIPSSIYPVPTPYSTYHKGDSYTTVFQPSEITTPNSAEPPKLTIVLPINNSLFRTNNFTATFNLRLEGSHPITLQGLFYETSWQSNNISIEVNSQRKYVNETLSFSIPFSNVPEGQQSITIHADTMIEFQTNTESASKPVSGIAGIPPYGNYFYVYSNYYFISGQSSADFTIDTSPIITPNPTSEDIPLNIDGQALLIGIIVLVFVGVIALLLFRRHRKTSSQNKPKV